MVRASIRLHTGTTISFFSRKYRVIWKRDDKGTSGVLFPGPLTHAEACTCMRKTTAYPWRRILIEEIPA